MVNLGIVSSSGLKNYIIVRISSIIILSLIIFLSYYIATHDIDYYTWVSLFDNIYMKTYITICALSVSLHAWIGMWGIITDYVKCNLIRASLIYGVILAVVVFFIACVNLIWSV